MIFLHNVEHPVSETKILNVLQYLSLIILHVHVY